MTVTSIESRRDQRANPVQLPSRVGQGTAVEQARAVAEVQAMVVVAQERPRNIQAAVEEMRESCRQLGLAQRAFYRYNRGGGVVTGASVHLARELARCWGNVTYGLVEMRRDDQYGQSEMQAFAWDLQTNTRNSSTFVVPHKRDTKEGPKLLTDMRDIYETNTNNGARRVREAIFAILPPWFVEEAKTLCSATLENGGGKPLAQRIADAVAGFEGIGVRLEQLEQKLDAPQAKWTAHDMAQLAVTFTSIRNGEVRKEDEFPPLRVTAGEILAKADKTAGPKPARQEPAAPDSQYEQYVAEQTAADLALAQESGR